MRLDDMTAKRNRALRGGGAFCAGLPSKVAMQRHSRARLRARYVNG
jgi:hypothetical protein